MADEKIVDLTPDEIKAREAAVAAEVADRAPKAAEPAPAAEPDTASE
jgi:hypothetical protein